MKENYKGSGGAYAKSQYKSDRKAVKDQYKQNQKTARKELNRQVGKNIKQNRSGYAMSVLSSAVTAAGGAAFANRDESGKDRVKYTALSGAMGAGSTASNAVREATRNAAKLASKRDSSKNPYSVDKSFIQQQAKHLNRLSVATTTILITGDTIATIPAARTGLKFVGNAVSSAAANSKASRTQGSFGYSASKAARSAAYKTQDAYGKVKDKRAAKASKSNSNYSSGRVFEANYEEI